MSEKAWVGRCVDCGAVRAVDYDQYREIANDKNLRLSQEEAPVQFGPHTCARMRIRRRPRRAGQE